MRELTFDEVGMVSGGTHASINWNNFSMSNGGNWDNTWAQTAIWATAGGIAGGRSIPTAVIGVLGGALGGFFGSFEYNW